MAGETKWTPKKGDTVWAARFGYLGAVETGSVTVKSVSDKQISLAAAVSAFGYATRMDPSCVGMLLQRSEADAIAYLVLVVKEEIAQKEAHLAKALAALAKARGEEPSDGR
jgi:predicted ATPase